MAHGATWSRNQVWTRTGPAGLALALLLVGCALPGPPPQAVATVPPAPVLGPAPGPDPAAVREIGFGTVADARTALSARADVEHTVRDTYEVFVDARAHAIWLFTLPGSAAYPALIRRQLADRAGRTVMTSAVFCEATQPACRLLQENTRLLDSAIMEQMNQGPSAPGTGGKGAAPGAAPRRMLPAPGIRT